MSNSYEPQAIEARWQARWKAERTFRTPNPGDPDFDASKPKYYILDMFPYPSGAGLHVGHPMGYIGSDIVARRKRMEGCNVLHPMGFDAFGLPAEQYAIQTGKHPGDTTRENIATYRRQLELIGLSYDWDRQLSTADPSYYRWTQWIFARLYDRGLAYQAEVAVWWCEALKTVLANEEVINGRSERGDHPCVRRPLKQWMLKITEYAQRLIDDLDLLDWPESVKTMQREWIGRSEGAEIDFQVEGAPGAAALRVNTTRPDTLYGATFMVIAPEHPLVAAITTEAQRAAVAAYRQEAAKKSELQRTELAKDKSGVFTGAYARNPIFAADDPAGRVPIFVGDYVLMTYGTGAIMCVPGHDERDFEFAQKFDLPVRPVVKIGDAEPDPTVCAPGDGVACNSPAWDGLPTAAAKQRAIEVLVAQGVGAHRVNFKLRDWLFSRQRYWGEPFPVLHKPDGTHERVPDAFLPVELPPMDDFAPPDDGSPPLSKATEWVNVAHPVTGEPVKRDTDTMPGWAGSCWYYLRFMDPTCALAPLSPAAEQYWQNVDLYIGGTEHAVLHLLYARFWHKVLYDCGVVSTKEPFQRLFNQGMLTAFAFKDSTGRLLPIDEVDDDGDAPTLKATGERVERIIAKMSKSLRNVVNPDDVCAQYGVDTFRVYEMFMGPLADSKPWNPRDVPGSRRFLDRAWRLLVDEAGDGPVRSHLAVDAPGGAPEGERLEVERALNQCIKRVDDSFRAFNFNTAISGFMEFVNTAQKAGQKAPEALTRDQARRFVRALAPFAPHIAEELWARLGGEGSVSYAAWPAVDERYLEADDFELAIQVLGKLRGTTRVPRSSANDKAFLEAAARAAIAEKLEGKEIVKVIAVPGKLVNFVVK
ncbi:MAG: leucine--tRNA ligase [Planctomycetota bacterium]